MRFQDKIAIFLQAIGATPSAAKAGGHPPPQWDRHRQDGFSRSG